MKFGTPAGCWLIGLALAATIAAASCVCGAQAEVSAPTDAGLQRIEQFRVMAERGDAVAQYNLGACYHNGDGVGRDEKEAVKWFRKAAAQGNATAQYYLGLSLINGHGTETNVVEGAQWYRKAAEQGLPQAQFDLGICYRDGVGVSKDPKEAVLWFRKGAEQGFAPAQQSLGLAYSKGDGVPQNHTEAFRWFRKAADQGDACAQNDLGLCYQNGEGIAENPAEAVRWFKRSAEQGYAPGQCGLAFCYMSGKGVVSDVAEAMKWLRRAAGQGYGTAQCRLGALLEVQGEMLEAAEWYRKAADKGLADAQFGLAGCYARGLGVRKDLAEAYKWLTLAQAGGASASASALKVLSQMMTPEQISEGQRRAQLLLRPAPARVAERAEPDGAANGSQLVEAISVRLRPDKARWASNEIPTFRVDVRNQGQREFCTFQSQEAGRLQVDGVWYDWTGAFNLNGSALLPKCEYRDIPVSLGTNWKATQEWRDKTKAPPPQIPLHVPPGKHTIRFAAEIRDITTKPKPQNNYVPSNPVEIEMEGTLKKPAEPDGAANGSQPIRSETNGTPPAAGSRR